MNKIYILALTLLSTAAYGQIQQDINKNGGTTESNPINDVDSIRFNSGSTEMEVILNNGSMESHTISDIDNVTFSGAVVPTYPPGYVHCGTPTAVVDVTNPNTGEIWMDRNLGATQAATSSTDTDAYGDLFQWGRFADGHQCRTSPNNTTLATTAVPNDGNVWDGEFITTGTDWLSTQDVSLWQGVNGINNPCPNGYRLPTESELDAERLDWSSNNSAGAFTSPLKLPVAGSRFFSDGSLVNVDTYGYYWSSTVSSTDSRSFQFNSSSAFMVSYNRASGLSVRCIKETGSQGEINSLDCGNANAIGTLEEGTAASGVSVDVDYTGGNGGAFTGQSITSTGVSGLTAQLSGGNFANGAGTLTYAISGTPSSAGTATFPVTIGGQSCNLDVTVDASTPTYPPGYVHCGTPTAIVEVTNPNTGEIWMDRNLGAMQAATSSTDTDSYGDLFQWGRFADGHQCRTSNTTTTLSTTDTPSHGDFIINGSNPFDWRSTQNDNLWQGVNGVNNPCPNGYRLPTNAEWQAERNDWNSFNASGAFGSVLQLPMAGYRNNNGGLSSVDGIGNYWSSSVDGNNSSGIYFNSGSASFNTYTRSAGFSVRCIKNSGSQTPGTINNLDCGNANTIGTLEEGTAASGVSVDVDYTGGDGGSFTGQSITSTGVTGLTAQLSGGNFANGAGTLTFAISGTPASAGTATFPLNIGGQSCNLELNVSGTAVGTINSLDCGNANTIGTLEEGTAAAGVSIDVDYTGGNGGTYTGQTITSTGVTGLTAQLSGGNFANGAGTLTFAISGTPASAGTATFPLNIGGQTCNLDVTVDAAGPYPPGYVHCGTPTAIVEVTNPTTNEVWMDRNLGAQQVATSSADTDAYGDLFQWGRFADGHQCRTSNTTATLSSTDSPGHGDFITINSSPYDWRSPQNDNLWQGVSGTNNPCPSGYRLPTEAELEAERLSWSSSDLSGAFGSPLRFPSAGLRNYGNGSVYVLTEGFYWTSSVTGAYPSRFDIDNSTASFMGSGRAYGASVRCIKD